MVLLNMLLRVLSARIIRFLKVVILWFHTHLIIILIDCTDSTPNLPADTARAVMNHLFLIALPLQEVCRPYTVYSAHVGSTFEG